MRSDPAIRIKLRHTNTNVEHKQHGATLRVMKTFTTLAGAKKYAQNLFGPHPEIFDGLAISSNGGMTIEALENCTLRDLFPPVDWSQVII